MLYLLSPRVWLALALAIAFVSSNVWSYRHGKSTVQAEWNAAKAAASEEARRVESLRQSKVDKASKDRAARENRLRADSVRLAGERDGLLDDLRATRDYASQSRATAYSVAKLSTELFEQCTNALVEMASNADRADSEARALREAWPK